MVMVAIEPEMDMSHLNSCHLVLVAYFDSCHCVAVDSHLPTMGRVSQAVSYPSPSQSPNMPGATSNSVRIDRGTKPAMYSSNLGPQGPLPSQPRMPHPSGLQYQPGYNVNQAGGYQQPHRVDLVLAENQTDLALADLVEAEIVMKVLE
jgi:hypothetical protein